MRTTIPQTTVHKINADINRVLTAADVRDKLVVQGLEPAPIKTRDFRSYMGSEITKWAKVVKASGSKVD